MKHPLIRSQEVLALALIAAGIVLRTLPHPENFTPLTAIALFSGMLLRPSLALWVPLTAVVASDYLQETHGLFWLTWTCFLLTTLIGMRLRGRVSALPVAGGTLSGTLLFYVLTNLGVWAVQDMYPKTAAGLAECYVMALPFLRNALAGDLVYAAAAYAAYRLVTRRTPALAGGR